MAVYPSDPAPVRVFGAAATFRLPQVVHPKKFPGGGGSRTPVLIREMQTSTGLAVYWIFVNGLAKQRAAEPYSG